MMLDRALIQHCPLCGDPARSPWLFGLGFELVRCDGCGHRYSTSVRAHNVMAKPVPVTRSAAAQQRLAGYLRLLEERLPARARVLDVGCNASDVLKLFRRKAKTPDIRVQGIDAPLDPALSVIDRVRRSGRAFWQQRVEDSLPQNECFELVVLSHVLEYSHQPGTLLRRLRDTLSARGRVLIEVPNADDRLLSLWRSAYRPLSPGHHVSFFDAAHLQQLLSRHGFVLEHMIAPTHACDLLYPTVQSALDAARAMIGVGAGRTSSLQPPDTSRPDSDRVRGRTTSPLRVAIDACLSAVDPAVRRVYGRERSELRGPVLMAVARVAA